MGSSGVTAKQNKNNTEKLVSKIKIHISIIDKENFYNIVPSYFLLLGSILLFTLINIPLMKCLNYMLLSVFFDDLF